MTTTNFSPSCPVHHFDHGDVGHTQPTLRVLYEELLTEPLSWSDQYGGFWILSRYEDVRSAELNPTVYSSAEGGVSLPRYADPNSRFLVLEQDPPEHSPYRRILTQWLDRARVVSAIPMIRRLTETYVERFESEGGGNVVTEVSEKLPVEIICHLLDLDGSSSTFRELSQRRSAGDKEALIQFADLILVEVVKRRDEQRDDLISALLATDIDGHRVTEQTAASLVGGVLVAGHETTLISGAGLLLELARDLELQEQLRSEPSLIPNAVAETLRLHGPVQSFFRTVTQDIDVHGETLRSGDKVMLLFGAANLDPEVFPNPTTFQIDRPNATRHLAYGHGIHRCVGATLAEHELAILAEVMLGRSFRLNGPVGFGGPIVSGGFLGFTDVPIAFD